jgi:hypothetical protein
LEPPRSVTGARRFRPEGRKKPYRKDRPQFQIRFELRKYRQRDQERGRGRRAFSFGTHQMESIRPGNSDPIPVPASQHHVGTIAIRFVGILFAAIAVMALLWSR